MYLWIVHFWLPLRVSLTFIYYCQRWNALYMQLNKCFATRSCLLAGSCLICVVSFITYSSVLHNVTIWIKWWVSYKKQQLLTLLEHMGSPRVWLGQSWYLLCFMYVWVVLLLVFSVFVFCLFCFCLFFVFYVCPRPVSYVTNVPVYLVLSIFALCLIMTIT